MGSPLYNFLTESFLFSDSDIENRFRRFTDQELRAELNRYREHALETAPDPTTLNPLDFRVSSGANVVSLDRLTQGAFYIQQVVTDDPIFRLTRVESEFSQVASQALGFDRDPDVINRDRLLDAVKYMKAITPMVAVGYVVPLPISYFFEPPEEIPLNAPTDQYASLLPDDLRKWFWDRVHLSSLERTSNGWVDRGNFELSRGIRVSFAGGGFDASYIYHLQKYVPLDFDEESGLAKFQVSIPDEPPDEEEFTAWVRQSVNGSAYDVLARVQAEASMAYDYGASYLAPHTLSFELLKQTIGTSEDIPSHTANTLLNLDLPLVHDVNIDTLMRIRRDEGEAFDSFRKHIERSFRNLRLVEDDEEKRIKLENELHELTESKVHEVEKEVRAIKKKLPFEVAISVLSLASGLVTGGVTTVASLAALGGVAKAGLTAQNYRTKALQHPAFFLWKVKSATDLN